MPVPSTINDLSTVAGSNGPLGSETPTTGDDYIRALSAFLAQLRDKLNGTSDTGTVKNAAVSGTFSGAASWSGAQAFDGGITAATATLGTTKTVSVTSDGRLYGTQLHNNAGSMTGATNQYVGSGTYVPAPVAGTNATAPTISTAWKWTRVGNVVSVSGTLLTGVLSAAGDTATIIYIPLPIASAFTVVSNLNGTAGTTVADKWHFVQADATNDRAELNFAASTTSGHAYYLTFSYEVV